MLVLFVGGLTALLLIGALVIDLGFAWMTQRHEQNAADTGAIAAARYIHPAGGGAANTTAMFQAACFNARMDGFFPSATDNTTSPTGCIPGNDPAGTSLTVNYPPGIGAGQYAGDPGDVEVILSQPRRTLLAGIVGLGVITVGTRAVAAFDTGNSNSSSLVALDPATCKAGQIT
ncbi:MAG TPA: pilus assembly protein TadG-related protein, partial [Candidatus Limnocylindrales bacterium]